MKILAPIINRGSGNDVYFADLQRVLRGRGIALELSRLAPYSEFVLPVAKRRVFRIGDSKDYALVHTNADYGTAFRMRGKPLILTVHHNVFDANYQRSTSLFQKAYHYGLLKRRLSQALGEADKVVAVSHSTKVSLEKVFGAGNVQVVYNGVDTELFRPKQVFAPAEFVKKTRLLFVGNLTKRKGADLLPLIMARLGDDYVLFYTESFRSRTRIRAPNMISLGVRSRGDLADIYNSCDIFLFPSRLEGFGYAVAEAMACGKPIVCTNGSSLPELVLNEKGGLLCERDQVEDFVEKVRFLSARAEWRHRMGIFNRQRIVENFTLDRMAARYEELYQTVLGG